MNDLPLPVIMADPSTPISMSSREIAELTGSRHDKVKQSVERLAAKGVIVQPPLGDEPGLDALGRPRTTQTYLFTGSRGKRDAIVVVAQLSPEFTGALVDRWEELERQVAQSRLPANQPPYRFRASTGRPELDHQLNLIQAVSERLPINNEVRAALLVQFLREHKVPLNIARTDLMRCNCAEDILEYGRGFKGAYQIARTAGAEADRQEARLDVATESLEGSLDAALVRAFALPGRGVAWLTIRQVLEIAGVRYTRPNALRAAEYLTKLYRVERKHSNRGKLYNMPARRGAARRAITRVAAEIGRAMP